MVLNYYYIMYIQLYTINHIYYYKIIIIPLWLKFLLFVNNFKKYNNTIN